MEVYSAPQDFETLLRKLPNRTERAIQHKLLRLGYRRRVTDVFGSKVWTSEEIILLKEKYSLLGAVRILEFLPYRTKTAIRKKARELELNIDWESRVVGKRFGRLVVDSRAYKSKPTPGNPFGFWYYKCICDCGNTIITCINSLRSKHTKSWGCLKKEFISKFRSGKNCNFWKGGVAKLHLLIRTSSKYAGWRTAVFKRDNYTCQKCDISGVGCLQVHHKKPFAEILEESGVTTIKEALEYSEFWLVENGGYFV